MHRSTFLSVPGGRLASAAVAPTAARAAPAPTLVWDRGGGAPVTSWDFSESANAARSTITFRVFNSSQSASSALTITVTGSAAFTKAADTCTAISLKPGTGCFVSISFFPPAPAVGQTFSGIATARPASQDRPTATMALTATITD